MMMNILRVGTQSKVLEVSLKVRQSNRPNFLLFRNVKLQREKILSGAIYLCTCKTASLAKFQAISNRPWNAHAATYYSASFFTKRPYNSTLLSTRNKRNFKILYTFSSLTFEVGNFDSSWEATEIIVITTMLAARRGDVQNSLPKCFQILISQQNW